MVILLLFLGAGLIFLATSVRYVPSNPPHIAVVTFLGNRTRETKREGYRLFPFYPVVFNAVLINITKRTQTLAPQDVRTGDHAEVRVSVSVTWTPNAQHAIEFLNHGGDNEVNAVLEGMIRERIREWASHSERTWKNAISAKDEATAMLIRDVAGLPEEESPSNERDLIRKIRQGNGVQPIPSLGITLNRLNIEDIIVIGELARDAELSVRKESQREGEKIQLAHVTDRVLEIMELGFTRKESLEIVQTERGKVAKKISEIRGDLSEETLAAVRRILSR